ncbi:MAG: hypothetical protein WC438_00675 [Candidatus Pacearchaeota archaeon]
MVERLEEPESFEAFLRDFNCELSNPNCLFSRQPYDTILSGIDQDIANNHELAHQYQENPSANYSH